MVEGTAGIGKTRLLGSARPLASAAEVENYMRGALSSTILDMVSIHEAFPGHYTQFLWAPKFPSRTRKDMP